MSRNEDPIIIPVEADFSGFQSAMNELEKSSKSFAGAFSGSIRTAIRSGQSFEDTLNTLALRLSNIGLQAGLRPLEKAVDGALSSVLSSLGGSVFGNSRHTGSTGFDIGSVISSAFSAIASPQTGAPSALSRTSANSVNSFAQSVQPQSNVTFNVSTPDVESFRRSQTQISTLLARSVSRSQRGL